MKIKTSELFGAATIALVEALKRARNGLQWYRDAYPEADSGADDEMLAEIDAALAAAPTTQPSPQQSGAGNSGFDHKTAADFLNGRTVSDEAMRKFVTASRWAHDDRAGLQAMLLTVRHELASREAEIALLKTAMMNAEAAAKQGGAA